MGIFLPLIPAFILVFWVVKSQLMRFFFSIFLLGFTFYSGIGYGFIIGIAQGYGAYFLIFTYTFSFSFILFNQVIHLRSIDFKYVNQRLRDFSASKRFFYGVILLYNGAFFVELIYPEFNLYRLISPPSPDILSSLNKRFEDSGSVPLIVSLLKYARTLIYPFYLMVLVKVVKRIPVFTVLLLLPIYLEFCSTAYVGRYVVLMALIFSFLSIWKFRPEKRRLLLVSTGLIVPLFLSLSFLYQVMRSGSSTEDVSLDVLQAVEVLLNIEVSLPMVSSKVLDQGKQTDLKAHVIWAATLPVPKFGLVKVDEGLPAYEISEMLTRHKRGTPGFWVPLSGYLTENVYVYGPKFFWIPAVFVAFFLCFMGKILQESDYFYGIALFIGLVIGLKLNRAGIQSALPDLINSNLLIYVFILMLVTKFRIAWKPSSSIKGVEI